MVKKEWDDDTFHDRVSDQRSLYLMLSDSISPVPPGYVATKLMCRLICNLPEYNIRIF